MKAAVYRRYGPPEVVKIETVARPAPKPNEVLIKIHASTVSSGDWRARSLKMPPGFGPIAPLVFGLFGPRQRILGSELAGLIETVGVDVTTFKVGDPVFAFPDFAMGAHAEYRTMREDGLIALKPANLSFAEAAALCFGGATALYYLKDLAKIRAGEKVLVVGASGAVGSAAVQLAKHFGADVTGVCSTANLDLVRSIGADRVIDHTKEDFTQSGARYDIICDAVGATSFKKCEAALTSGGRLILIAAGLPQVLAAGSKPGGKHVLAGPGKTSRDHILLLKTLAEAGSYKPVIDQCFPLEQIVAAHARVDSGRKRGSVVVIVAS